ncbi:GYD domain-containing protein [Bradyrhizobium sp.]|uniref:GYD domain-containing protein n=1 Tax=Bradyrhizobium sp. TaxID=376 RepID=UPI002CD16B83|nr:GYD domain-containing protein [Bradyrhizobium sp.]HMM89565.1 GYD domain-containing protein [Bradyrhizobium sp.]
MPTYISLINFTQKGAEAIKDGPRRLEMAKQRFRDAGAELKAFYLVMGQYDAVSIVEAPNDEVVAKLALGNAALGFVRSQTCRAFGEDDYKRIVASL